MTVIDTRVQGPTEKMAELTEFGLYLLQETSPGDTTTDVTAAADQKVVSVTSETNFTAEDYVMMANADINQLEIGRVGATAAGQLTMKSNLFRALASGVAVKELVKVQLGETTTDGIRDGSERGVNVHHVGTQHGPWDSTPGHHNTKVEVDVVNFTLDNLKFALGLADGAGSGAGSFADPWELDQGLENWGKELLQVTAQNESGRIALFYALGEYLNTGEIWERQWWSCNYADGDQGIQLAVNGDPAMAKFQFMWFSNRRELRYAPS